MLEAVSICVPEPLTVSPKVPLPFWRRPLNVVVAVGVTVRTTDEEYRELVTVPPPPPTLPSEAICWLLPPRSKVAPDAIVNAVLAGRRLLPAPDGPTWLVTP